MVPLRSTEVNSLEVKPVKQGQDAKTRTIPLTDRPPVRIREDLWPTIAVAKDYDSEFECQANRTWALRVRQHQDGRAVVYGSYETRWRGERDITAGELLTAGDDIPAAILRTAQAIGASDRLAQECIADLPAEELQ